MAKYTNMFVHCINTNRDMDKTWLTTVNSLGSLYQNPWLESVGVHVWPVTDFFGLWGSAMSPGVEPLTLWQIQHCSTCEALFHQSLWVPQDWILRGTHSTFLKASLTLMKVAVIYYHCVFCCCCKYDLMCYIMHNWVKATAVLIIMCLLCG